MFELIKKAACITFLLALFSQTAFSQLRTEVVDGDTLLIFSHPMKNLINERIQPSIALKDSFFSYSYTVTSQSISEQNIWLWLIISDSDLVDVSTPTNWNFTSGGNPNRVSWAARNNTYRIKPGSSLEGFNFLSEKLPTIQDYYMEGWAQIILQPGQEPDSTENDSFFDTAKKGTTIFPREAPISSLSEHIDTLETYRSRSCSELGWANDAAVCSTLKGQLSDVRSFLAAGDSVAAASTLAEFINLVEQEKDASLSSEGYALLFFNARYLADRLPEPEDEEPTGGFAIPELPAALTISSASASGAFSADNFSITGAGHDLSGSPDGSSAVHGIVTTTASARQGITGGLQSFQQDNITGSGSQPDVVQQNLSFDPQALIDSVLAGVQQTIPVNASGTFGSAQAPVILHAAQGIQSSATVTGTGILLIDGPFFVSGNFNWTGLVIHRGSPFSGPALSVSTSLQITGAMLTVNEGPWPASIQVSNIFELRYSGPALQLLRDSLTPQN